MAKPDSASERKRIAILEAAERIFLDNGYVGASMDDLAHLSGVSKQTVYSHFGNKEGLFVALVTAMTEETSSRVHDSVQEPTDADELERFLTTYALRQLTAVMTPRILQLRRLVIGEVGRFPDLARALYESGPKLAMERIAGVFRRLDERGLLRIPDPAAAASQFNWLVMGESLNVAMLLGDAGQPKPAQLKRQSDEAVRMFLAAYRNQF